MQFVVNLRRFADRPRSVRPAPASARAIAFAAVLALLLAEWASLHHLATAELCTDHGNGLPALAQPAGDDPALQRGSGETPRLFAFDARTSGELQGDLCHLCRSSRDRFAAGSSSVAYADARVDPTAVLPAAVDDIAGGAAVFAIAPKTSPPA